MNTETTIDDLAHEAWSAAQLAPGEGIEDAARRIAGLISSALDSQARQIEALTAERDELRKRLDEAKPATPAPGEWIEWRGGDVAPVADGTLIEIRNRKGDEWSRHVTPDLDWSHITRHPLRSDIIAYRILP
jgi:hypothetical protein